MESSWGWTPTRRPVEPSMKDILAFGPHAHAAAADPAHPAAAWQTETRAQFAYVAAGGALVPVAYAVPYAVPHAGAYAGGVRMHDGGAYAHADWADWQQQQQQQQRQQQQAAAAGSLDGRATRQTFEGGAAEGGVGTPRGGGARARPGSATARGTDAGEPTRTPVAALARAHSDQGIAPRGRGGGGGGAARGLGLDGSGAASEPEADGLRRRPASARDLTAARAEAARRARASSAASAASRLSNAERPPWRVPGVASSCPSARRRAALAELENVKLAAEEARRASAKRAPLSPAKRGARFDYDSVETTSREIGISQRELGASSQPREIAISAREADDAARRAAAAAGRATEREREGGAAAAMRGGAQAHAEQRRGAAAVAGGWVAAAGADADGARARGGARAAWPAAATDAAAASGAGPFGAGGGGGSPTSVAYRYAPFEPPPPQLLDPRSYRGLPPPALHQIPAAGVPSRRVDNFAPPDEGWGWEHAAGVY